MQKNTTVIEITNQYIKLSATKPSLKGNEIIKLSVKKISSGNTEDTTKELALLLKELKFIPSPLFVSFPRNLVTMRNLHLPSVDPKEIEGMIDLHMGRQAPYPREEIIGSYQNLGSDETGYSKIILAVSHRDALRHVFNCLNSVNLFPEKIELSSQGCLSWFLHNERARLSAGVIYGLLDIDTNFTDFMIMDKEKLLFSRSVAFGADQFGSSEQAQAKLVSELKQSLVIFQSEEMNKKPDKIFISGATDNIKGISEALNQEMNIEVLTTKPRINLSDIPGNVSVSSILGLSVDTKATRINFILPEVQIRRALKERSKELIILGSLMMLILMISLGIFMARLYNRGSYSRLLSTRYLSSKSDIEDLDTMVKKTRIVSDWLNSRVATINHLYQIQKLLPAELVLKIIDLDADNKVTLRGQAQVMSDIFSFVNILDNSSYFKDIQVKYTTKKKIADKELTEFEIVCPIAKESGSSTKEAPK